MQNTTFAGTDFSNCFSFFFKVNHVFMEEKDNPVGKVFIDEDKLNGIEIDGILNLENVSRKVFID